MYDQRSKWAKEEESSDPFAEHMGCLPVMNPCDVAAELSRLKEGESIFCPEQIPDQTDNGKLMCPNLECDWPHGACLRGHKP
jgi:hypothetical protein